MRSKLLVFLLLVFALSVPLVDNSSGQGVLAAVDIECSPVNGGSIDIEVSPGASLTGYTICTVSNPTIHVEKISIQVQSDGLAAAAPGSVTVAAGGEEEFQVTVRADTRMSAQARSLSVTATVQEISGVPPPNSASSTSNNIVNILQFAEFNVEMESPVAELQIGDNYQLEFMIYNTGNGMDKFNIRLDYDEVDSTSLSLATSKVQIESYRAGIFKVSVNTPSDGSEWEVDSSGRHILEMNVNVVVESDLGCQNGNCLTTTMTQQIILFQNQTSQGNSASDFLSSSMDNQVVVFGGIGVLVILLIILMIILRKS